ncbi:MAG: Ger(x)C family spore germination protein [Bacillota bacterium]|nr:Ger(x)C family spore germination protein [Bacillota bacterium]
MLRRFRRLVPLLAPALTLCAVCSGCWDRTELEDIAWVQAVGFDKGPNNTVVTTLQIGIPRSLRGTSMGGSPSGGQQSENVVMSAASETGLETLQIAAVSLGRRVSLQHAALYVFSDELARGDIRSLVGALERYREVRLSAFIAVSKGRAEDVIRLIGSPIEQTASRFLQIIMQQHSTTGLFETQFLGDFIEKMEVGLVNPTAPLIALAPSSESQSQGSSGQDQSQSGGAGSSQGGIPPTPKPGERIEPQKVTVDPKVPQSGATSVEAGGTPRIGGGPVEMIGTAVFSGGKMVGTLTGEETRALLMVKGDMETGGFSIPDPMAPDKPELSLSVTLHGRGTKVHAKRHGEKVELDVNIRLLVTYLAPKTGVDYSDPRTTPLVKKACEQYVKQLVDGVIAKTQKEHKSDVLGFGDPIRHTFATWPELDRFAWQTKYPDAEVRTSVDVTIQRHGLTFAPPHIPIGETIRSK